MKAIIVHDSCWIENYIVDNYILGIIDGILISSGFTIVNSIDHDYEVYAYSKVWLLAESHLAVHTFPEDQKIYLELSSCNEQKAIFFWKNFEIWANDKSILFTYNK